jgi:sugar-specific transcriptional regulator TrmB
MNDWKERKHELFESCEELIREVQEQLLWCVEARNKAKGLMLWALKRSLKDFHATFELLTDAYKGIEDELGRLKRLRVLQLGIWRVEMKEDE